MATALNYSAERIVKVDVKHVDLNFFFFNFHQR